MKLKIIIISLFLSVQCFAQLTNSRDKTASQLGAIVSGVTVPDKTFFDDKIFTRMVEFVNRFESETINVEDFSSTKDQAAIVLAIAAIDSGIVYIPAGTWTITDTIQLKSNLIIQGAGVGVTILDRPNKSVKAGLFSIVKKSNVIIRDLTIRGHAKDNGGYDEFMHGIFIQDAVKIWIYNLVIENFGGDGITVSDTSSSIFLFNNVISIPNKALVSDTLVGRNGISVVGGKNIWIVGNHIKDGGIPGGIDIEPANGDSVVGVYIYDNTITSPGSASPGVGISLTETDETQTIKSIFVERNDISNYTIGIRTTKPDSVIVIKNNKVHHNSTWGILITQSDNVLVEGNEVYSNSTHGIEATTNQNNIHIIGNRVSFNGGYGIDVVGSNGNELNNTIVSNNVVWNNSQTTDGSKEGILITFADSTILTGNISYNDLGLTNRQKFGFVINSNDYIHFANNSSWNNKDGELSQTNNTGFSLFGNRLGFDTSLDIQNTATVAIIATGSSVITFDTNSSERMRIASDGKTGIGTTSPQSLLDVAGAITADLYNFAADGQADDDYEIAVPGISALTTGLMVTWTATTANTDGATLEITSVGDLDAILKLHDQALVTGDIEAGQVVVTVFDGTNWQMISQIAQ